MSGQRLSRLLRQPLVHAAICLGVGAAVVLVNVLF